MAEPAPAAPAAPAVSAGQEPSPAPTPPATPEVPAAAAPPVQPSGTEPDDIPDPTPEELALLNEPGQRALKAEREARKAAKTESRALKAKLAELEAKLAAPPAPVEPEAPTTTLPSATPSVATPALADCNTFAEAEARGLAAAQTEARVIGLQNVLQYQGPEAVAAKLAELGVANIGGRPVAEATPEQLAGFLSTTLAGTKMTQLQVEPRKRFIAQLGTAYQQAVKIVPEMADATSPVHKQLAAFVAANPVVKSDPRWPLLVAKLYLGELAWAAKNKSAPTPPPAPRTIVPAANTIPIPIVPPLRAAPGAPARSSAALPPSNRLAELSEKINSGKATLKEVDEYSALAVGG